MKKRYLVPPKLQGKLLLAGLSISEIGIACAVAVIGFFSSNKLNAISWTAIWLICVARLFKGKSLLGIIYLLLNYHFFSPQQFVRTRRKKYAKSKH